MATNSLCLNDGKIEFIRFSMRTTAELDGITISVGNSDIPVVFQTRKHGVILQAGVSMKSQISNVFRAAHYHLRTIGWL